MEHVAHQTIIIQYLLELAKQLKASPKAPQLISSFFSKYCANLNQIITSWREK